VLNFDWGVAAWATGARVREVELAVLLYERLELFTVSVNAQLSHDWQPVADHIHERANAQADEAKPNGYHPALGYGA